MIKIDFLYIIIGIIIGYVIIKITSSPPKIIMKYPTLENINDTVYVDDNGQCYKYYATMI